jgi:hypothetical protein
LVWGQARQVSWHLISTNCCAQWHKPVLSSYMGSWDLEEHGSRPAWF